MEKDKEINKNWKDILYKEVIKEGGILPDGTKVTKLEIIARKLCELGVNGDVGAMNKIIKILTGDLDNYKIYEEEIED